MHSEPTLPDPSSHSSPQLVLDGPGPVCVECGSCVPSLYKTYSGGSIRLTPCSQCENFADKYVEVDGVLVFIDMLLHRTQVYRHLLFNRLRPSAKWGGWNDTVVKLSVLLVLFEVYVKWFRLEKAHGRSAFPSDDWPLASQYLCILFLCAMDTLVWHLGTRFAASVLLPTHEDYQTRRAQLPGPRTESEVNLLADHAPTPPFQLVTSALVISSFGKLLPILMVIWDYEELAHAWVVSLVVLSSNAKALGAIGVRGFGAAGLILATGLGFKVGWQLLARAVLNPLIIVDPF